MPPPQPNTSSSDFTSSGCVSPKGWCRSGEASEPASPWRSGITNHSSTTTIELDVRPDAAGGLNARNEEVSTPTGEVDDVGDGSFVQSPVHARGQRAAQ